MDTLGQNLNRYYSSPDLRQQPSIFAAKSLLDSYAKAGRLALYLDYHAHASKRGCFIYGNVMDSLEDQVQNQIFCRLIAMNTPHFDYDGCLFSREHMTRIDPGDLAKGLTAEGSGRVDTYLSHGLVHSYTIECNYNTGRMSNEVPACDVDPGGQAVTGASVYMPSAEKYTPSSYASVGRACVVAMLDIRGQNPCSRINQSKYKTLDRLRQFIVAEVRGRKEYRNQQGQQLHQPVHRDRRKTVGEVEGWRRVASSWTIDGEGGETSVQTTATSSSTVEVKKAPSRSGKEGMINSSSDARRRLLESSLSWKSKRGLGEASRDKPKGGIIVKLDETEYLSNSECPSDTDSGSGTSEVVSSKSSSSRGSATSTSSSSSSGSDPPRSLPPRQLPVKMFNFQHNGAASCSGKEGESGSDGHGAMGSRASSARRSSGVGSRNSAMSGTTDCTDSSDSNAATTSPRRGRNMVESVTSPVRTPSTPTGKAARPPGRPPMAQAVGNPIPAIPVSSGAKCSASGNDELSGDCDEDVDTPELSLFAEKIKDASVWNNAVTRLRSVNSGAGRGGESPTSALDVLRNRDVGTAASIITVAGTGAFEV